MAQVPSTTIIPFNALPSCAAGCGPLYDANGGCVPPVAPTGDINSYGSCFCQYGRLQPFREGTSGVCDGQCGADGLSSIQSWFTSFCADKVAGPTATASTSSGIPSGTSAAGSNGSNQGGGSWIQNHLKWVIMIIVIVVGIIAIWTGACIWRRKYLKKKDRMYELGKGLPSSVAVNTQGNLVGPGVRDSTYNNEPGAFMSSGNGIEKNSSRR